MFWPLLRLTPLFWLFLWEQVHDRNRAACFSGLYSTLRLSGFVDSALDFYRYALWRNRRDPVIIPKIEKAIFRES
jgi:hypothetical protein